MEDYHDLYDRVAKRCLTLSNRAVVLMLNGLFGEEYDVDSRLTYQWTEHENEDLKRTLADTIITVNGTDSYHIEFQMSKDGSIVLRILEYGFYHAMKHQWDREILEFPEPILICLYENESEKDTEDLVIRFGTQGEFIYRVPVVKYLKMSIEELNRRHMMILLPFQLLKLRKNIEKERTKENLEALKTLVTHDIIQVVRANVDAGNITVDDARKIKRMTLQVYHHIYDRYGEMEEEGVNEVVEEALILDIDVIEKEHRDELKALEAEKQKKIESLVLDIDVIEKEHRDELKALEAEKQKKIESLILDIDVIEKEHRDELKALEAEKLKEIESKQKEIGSLESRHQKELQALRLLLKGKDVQEISELTGLSENAILSLQM